MANDLTRGLSWPRSECLFVFDKTFRPHPVSGSHDYEFSMCGNHDSVHHPCRHVELGYHGRLPHVGLIVLAIYFCLARLGFGQNRQKCVFTSSLITRRILERATGVEPATSSLGSWHSTTELRPLRCVLTRSRL